MTHFELSEVTEKTLTPSFLTEEEQALFSEAILGKDAVEFMNSDLGRVLRGYAAQNIEEAKEALLKVPVWRKRKIQQLQFKAAVANQFFGFIREAVVRGEMAIHGLNQLRDYK